MQLRITKLLVLLVVLPAISFGQATIGTIDLYGPELVPRDRLLNFLLLHEGDTLRQSPGQLQKKLLQLPAVRAADVQVVCCSEGRSNVFVGLDSVAPVLNSHVYSNRSVLLPDTVLRLHKQFQQAFQAAVLAGDSEDDLEEGYSLMKNAAVRTIQQKFITVANNHYQLLSRVLAFSAHAGQRAVAAQVLAYANSKAAVSRIYQKALHDPDPGVRNNVLRALTGLSLYAIKHPGSGIVVPAETIVSLLHSVYWTDRDKALFCLVALTETRDAKLYAVLKKTSLPALIQMSQWKSKGHAFLAYIVLGRLVGIEDEKIFASWQQQTVNLVLDAARKAARFSNP